MKSSRWRRHRKFSPLSEVQLKPLKHVEVTHRTTSDAILETFPEPLITTDKSDEDELKKFDLKTETSTVSTFKGTLSHTQQCRFVG